MAEKKNEEVFNLESLFSRGNEEAGVWHQPVVNYRKIDVEFQLVGPNSDTAYTADDEFDRERELIKDDADSKEKNDKLVRLLAKRYAKYIKGIRCPSGRKLVMGDGHEATLDDMEDFLYNSPAILNDIIKFAGDQEHFLGK